MMPLEAGQELPALDTGRWTNSRLVRWCAAQQNWHRIHYDFGFATKHEGLPNVIINGALKQHLLVQFLEHSLNSWIWRLDYQFISPDFVDETLQVRGHISDVRQWGPLVLCSVHAVLCNLDKGTESTRCTAVVAFDANGAPVKSVSDVPEPPPDVAISVAPAPPDPAAPQELSRLLGTVIDENRSCGPVDASRLRLFAAALGDVAPWHYDTGAARANGLEQALACALFPLHAIELPPGHHELNQDPDYDGREASAEVGHGIDRLLPGLRGRVLNGGNRVEIHSLVAEGECVQASSTLVGAKQRTGRASGSLLVVETLNRYSTTGGRPLLTARSTQIIR